MVEFENNAYFWQKLDALYLSGDFKVTYKKGDKHPKYHGLVFPCDYGHIETISSDAEQTLKVMKGEEASYKVCAIVVCANLLDKDVNVVALVGMDSEKQEEVLSFLNQNDYQKTVIIRRGKDVPNWAVIE